LPRVEEQMSRMPQPSAMVVAFEVASHGHTIFKSL
jgi:hypothetical protein